MKIKRRGYYKNKGSARLVDTDIIAQKPDGYFYPTWDADDSVLRFTVKGIQGSTTYEYDLELSARELAFLTDTALTAASKEVAIHAHSKSIAAFIREALHAKHKKAANA
jgi:hypothetical protein